MKDKEIIFAAAILIFAYWHFVLRRRLFAGGDLPGRNTTGRSGTVGGGADKRFTIHQNSNARTNAQQGGWFSPTQMAYTGPVPGGPATSNVGGTRRGGRRSSITTGPAGSFVSNAWPTRRVTSMGSQRISRGITQIPSYTAIPLTAQGPGGGGTLVQ